MVKELVFAEPHPYLADVLDGKADCLVGSYAWVIITTKLEISFFLMNDQETVNHVKMQRQREERCCPNNTLLYSCRATINLLKFWRELKD